MVLRERRQLLSSPRTMMLFAAGKPGWRVSGFWLAIVGDFKSSHVEGKKNLDFFVLYDRVFLVTLIRVFPFFRWATGSVLDWFFYSTKVIWSILHRAIRSSRGVRNCQISPTGSCCGLVVIQSFHGVQVPAASSAFDLVVQFRMIIYNVRNFVAELQSLT